MLEKEINNHDEIYDVKVNQIFIRIWIINKYT